MARWLGIVADPEASGSGLDDLVLAGAGTPLWPVTSPTFVPVTSAQIDDGRQPTERNDEVIGTRANRAPSSFAAAPSLTFSARAYPKLLRQVIRKALGGAITGTTGTPPAAVSSTVAAVASGNLPASLFYLVREEQLDRLSGGVYSEFVLDFPVDGEGTVEATVDALYHDVDVTSAIAPAMTPAYTGYTDTFQLRDITAWLGDTPVLIDCLAGFGLSWSNNMIDDFRSRFCAGKNVEKTVLDTVTHKLWYPNQNKLGPQLVTGRLDFGDVRPDRELRKLLSHAEKLVVEAAAGPLGTTPAADEMVRFTLYKHVLTGGGAEPLQRDGDQISSYEFTAYLDESTGKDVEATFVGTAALT